ncbi:MAG: PIG-L family deacetylase, partial [Abditibacteriaceae bacterium]
MQNNRVLALMPHPDDIEILCAGTLIRLKELGYEIHTATMTPGDKGTAEYTSEEISAIRREEGKKAAEVIGSVSHHCLEFRDLEIIFDNPSRLKVAATMRKVNPFMIFTTASQDYMFDHEITSALVRDASFAASVPLYTAKGNPTDIVPYLYYADAVEGHNYLGQPSPVS